MQSFVRVHELPFMNSVVTLFSFSAFLVQLARHREIAPPSAYLREVQIPNQ